MLYSIQKIMMIILTVISSYQNIDDTVIEKKEDVILKKNSTNVVEKNIMKLLIPKISVDNNIYDKNSVYNDIDKNVEIMKDSNMPDDVKGNVILGGHSGTGKVAYFKNLDLLDYGDDILLEYRGKLYKYKVINKYLDSKNGSIVISRNENTSSVTLFTCMPGDRENYLIIIAKLV